MAVVFQEIDKHAAVDVVIAKHYLHRKCPISWAWGVRDEKNRLLGVLTIGKPVSWSVMCSLVGESHEDMTNPEARSRDVYELNRLWLDDALPKNTESRFIGWCLRELKKLRPNTILVSLADGSKGHVGYVYQATNWIYTGQSLPFTDICVEGYTDYRSVPQELRGGFVYVCPTHGKFPTAYAGVKGQPAELPCPECAALSKRLSHRSWSILPYLLDESGTRHAVTRVPRSIKHRYVMFCNSADVGLLHWPSLPYPKLAAKQVTQ